MLTVSLFTEKVTHGRFTVILRRHVMQEVSHQGAVLFMRTADSSDVSAILCLAGQVSQLEVVTFLREAEHELQRH